MMRFAVKMCKGVMDLHLSGWQLVQAELQDLLLAHEVWGWLGVDDV